MPPHEVAFKTCVTTVQVGLHSSVILALEITVQPQVHGVLRCFKICSNTLYDYADNN